MRLGPGWTVILLACCLTAALAQPNSPAPPTAASPASPTPPAKTAPAAPPPAPAKKASKKKQKPVRPPKFEKKIAANPQLLARVQALLPQGTTLEAASHGFKSETLFLATLHASHDLSIPFDKLKADITGTERDSLGQAIWNYHPEFDLKEIEDRAKAAEQQAKADIKQTRVPKRKAANQSPAGGSSAP